MCARTATIAKFKDYYEQFQISDDWPDGGLERYNLGPSSYRRKDDVDSIKWEHLPAIRSIEGKRQFDMLIWSLIPHWKKGILPNFFTANCRTELGQSFSETIQKKASFRNAWNKDKRCLLPVTSFYEWDQRIKPKQPYLIKDKNSQFLVLAGLWESSTTEDGFKRTSCTILTTVANECLENVGHPRSPIMLNPDQYETWLTGSKEDAETLLKPYPSDTLQSYKVSKAVNNPSYDAPELLLEAA